MFCRFIFMTIFIITHNIHKGVEEWVGAFLSRYYAKSMQILLLDLVKGARGRENGIIVMIIVVAEKGFALAHLCVLIEIGLEFRKLFVFNHQIEKGFSSSFCCCWFGLKYLLRKWCFLRFRDWFRSMSWCGGSLKLWMIGLSPSETKRQKKKME